MKYLDRFAILNPHVSFLLFSFHFVLHFLSTSFSAVYEEVYLLPRYLVGSGAVVSSAVFLADRLVDQLSMCVFGLLNS
jgi:hypothetical protein